MTDLVPSHAVVPPWSTPVDACRLILRGVTFRTCVRVAIVVGTILTAANQGSVIAGGDASPATWIRVGVNYVVPFIASSIGYLAIYAQPAYAFITDDGRLESYPGALGAEGLAEIIELLLDA